MISATNDFFPIGGIAPLGGLLEENSFWMLCDGREFPAKDYSELFAVIGRTYGGSAEQNTFKLPDYRGYFLRGTDYGTNRDPDVSSRTPPPGSTETDTVGSTQPYATKLPKTPFKADVVGLPRGTVSCDGGVPDNRARTEGDLSISTCTKGGDGDTRPVNVYVAYYIKARP